jgi:membrane protein DedA with SNARE-associated domain
LASFLSCLPIEAFVAHYGYWAVFLIVGLESAGMPLPGEITLVTAAVFAATTSSLDIGLVIAVAVAGAVTGDNIGYWVGRKFGFFLLLRYGSKIGIGERQVKLGQLLFLRHGGKVVFFGRMIALLRVLAALLAGVNRMAWSHFLACNVGGGILWATLYGGGAFLFGRGIQKIAGPASFVLLFGGIIAMVGSAHYLRKHLSVLEDAAERAFPGPLEGGGKDA